MASQSARTLRLVDPDTGELTAAPKLQELQDTVDGLQHTIRSQSATIGRLKRDLNPEEDHDLFPAAKRLHDFWRERCNHPKSKFSPERFKEVLPRLKEHGEGMCRRAIEGAAYDCFTTVRKNGTVKRHDGWELIFRHDKFEEMVNRAPYHLPDPKAVVVLAKALTFLTPDLPLEQAIEEAKVRLS